MGQPENKGFFGCFARERTSVARLICQSVRDALKNPDVWNEFPASCCCVWVWERRGGQGGRNISSLLFSRWRENYFTCQSDIPHASHAGSPAPKKEEGKKGHTILISRKEEEEEVSVCPRVEEGNIVAEEEEEEEESNSFPLSPFSAGQFFFCK